MTVKRLKIEAGFILFTAVLVFLDKGGLLWVVWTAALAHELGHYLALKAFGGKISGIVLSGGGISMIQSRTPRLSYAGDLLAVLAGPMASLGLALLLALRGAYLPLAGICLIHGLFNLLPITGLDGGRALSLIFENAEKFNTGDRILHRLSVAVLVVLLVLGVWMAAETRGNLSLLLAAGYAAGQRHTTKRTL
ncbi:MAG: hypothetical protein FWH04_05120 [Oscillospiraceae bacterium]|nr:hypothetical protein [Oscillospiraceae bacterium]